MLPLVSRMSELEHNLLSLYRTATAEDTSKGLAWYPSAHQIVCEWAETYRLPIATVACVVSALSPQCEWSRNLIVADDLLAGRAPSVGGPLPSNIVKAERILQDRAVVTLPYFPQGPKVCTFAANLAGNYTVATVDTHALQAALADVQATLTLKWARYNVVSQCYVNVARCVGLQPAHFQAILWHTWKRLYPWGRKQKLRQQWYVVGMEDRW